MVKHCVLFRFKPDTSPEAINTIFRELANLKGKIPGLLDFCGGPYSSPEGLNKGYTHGFIMTFDTEENRDIYLDHPDHIVVKDLILPHLDGGLDGVVAFDFLV